MNYRCHSWFWPLKVGRSLTVLKKTPQSIILVLSKLKGINRLQKLNVYNNLSTLFINTQCSRKIKEIHFSWQAKSLRIRWHSPKTVADKTPVGSTEGLRETSQIWQRKRKTNSKLSCHSLLNSLYISSHGGAALVCCCESGSCWIVSLNPAV